MKRSFIVSILLLTHLIAEDEALFDALEEVTEIATKTKLNLDYVPGTVSVIYGKDLKAKGITNLNQLNAYDMVIGMESSALSLRGVGAMYGANGNKIKWLINGRVIESELSSWGVGRLFIPIPIDYIEKIEFIRGAGSAIYGGNAIFGVINIITKKDTNAFFGGYEYLGGSNKAREIGTYGYIKEGDLSLNLNLSKYLSDGYDLYVGTKGHFYNDIDGQQHPEYKDGMLGANSKAHNIMLDANYKNYNLWIYHFATKIGQGYVDWYPTDYLAPNNGSYHKASISTLLGVEKKFYINDDLTISPQIGMIKYKNPVNNYVKFPIGFWDFDENKYIDMDYEDEKSYGQIDLDYKLNSHRLSSGVFFQKTKAFNDKLTRNYHIDNPTSKEWYERTILKTHRTRIQKAIYVQDIFDINDKMTLTTGLRYDNFSDVDKAYSPRIAGVYAMNDSNILKAQFSKSFRPPSFFELYGYMTPKPLKPEIVDTIELAYIFKSDYGTYKSTIFDSKMNNMIIQHYYSYYFENLKKDANVRGVELEYDWKSKNFEIGLNGAFYDTHNKETFNNFSLSSKFMGNANLKYILKQGEYLNLWYHYISKKPLIENSSNGYLSAQDYVNATYTTTFKDVELNIGVKNLFDKVQETLYMPLNPKNSEGIPYIGQSFWVNFNYSF